LFSVNDLGSFALLHRFPGFFDLFGLLVALVDVAIVFKVIQKLTPGDELLVVDCILLVAQVGHFIHLIALNLN
jgi:hypothetical protein